MSLNTTAAPRLYRFGRLTIFMEKCRDFGPLWANGNSRNNLILPYPTGMGGGILPSMYFWFLDVISVVYLHVPFVYVLCIVNASL
jgi:hypothetical protein